MENSKFYYKLLVLLLFTYVLSSNANQNETASTLEKDIDHPYNLSIDYMDELLYCSVISEHVLQVDDVKIKKLKKEIKGNENIMREKLFIDLLKVCLNVTSMKEVKKLVNNLTLNEDYRPDASVLNNNFIDYTKYKSNKDFKLTNEDLQLQKLVDNVQSLYQQKMNLIDEDNKKIRVGKFDIENIPNSVKAIFFIVIIGGIFGGTSYFLIKLKKSKDIREKKIKKKNK